MGRRFKTRKKSLLRLRLVNSGAPWRVRRRNVARTVSVRGTLSIMPSILYPGAAPRDYSYEVATFLPTYRKDWYKRVMNGDEPSDPTKMILCLENIRSHRYWGDEDGADYAPAQVAFED